MVDVKAIIALALIIGVPIAMISGVLFGIFWLFHQVNSYLAVELNISGGLLLVMSVICTLILGIILAYIIFWVIIYSIIVVVLLIMFIVALFD